MEATLGGGGAGLRKRLVEEALGRGGAEWRRRLDARHTVGWRQRRVKAKVEEGDNTRVFDGDANWIWERGAGDGWTRTSSRDVGMSG